jgi:hypothetical protein
MTNENQGQRFTPSAAAPWSAVVDLWREEMDRLAGEQQKMMERSFQEAERMLGEAYRVASTQLVANQEAARRFTTAFKQGVETLSKQA